MCGGKVLELSSEDRILSNITCQTQSRIHLGLYFNSVVSLPQSPPFSFNNLTISLELENLCD